MREILISESAWEEMTCLFAPSIGKSKHVCQPYRHEWISVRLFQAFIGERTDAQWLADLEHLKSSDEKSILGRLVTDLPDKHPGRDKQSNNRNPLITLPPIARTVAWLILSHHRLPQSLSSTPQLEYCEGWIDRQLNVDWNSLNHKNHPWGDSDYKNVWLFPDGTPLRSAIWCEKARQIGRRVKNVVSLQLYGKLDNLFTAHLARMSLMLADHFYSSQPPEIIWQDSHYNAWANSDRNTKQLKQRLDEHNTGVAHYALLLGRSLPRLRRTLPAIARHKTFRERAKDARFSWQNRAWDVAFALRERSVEQGFFGVNMASTGCGKTFANARIMYALADEQEGCRFSVALGLRTLTLQTGRALQSRLGLDEDSLAVVTGSAAVRELYEQNRDVQDNNSVSDEAFFSSHQYVHYEGSTGFGITQQWLSAEPALNRLVNAPVLVTTVDHLMPATEGVRGGRQIPAMLRLLTSDLVLDEPDDFDIDDLHALCRLVNWAGMLGSRILLSSATLPPALVEALFEAYRKGREAYQSACGIAGKQVKICCAWFDEYGAQSHEVTDDALFRHAHSQFVVRRVAHLPQQPRLRLGKLAVVEPAAATRKSVVTAVAGTLYQQMLELHQKHHTLHQNGKTISFGLIRLANINPLVASAQALMAIPAPQNYAIHYCIYHSQHPLAVRSNIENRLDRAFTRHDSQAIWHLPEVKQALASPSQHHLFVVIASPVIEVGRDFDADWGIIEPSSMRSLIQFAGRIQRHRQQVPTSENLVILNRNLRALLGQKVAYCQPGFEAEHYLLREHDLRELLPEATYRAINAVPRIMEQLPDNALAALEHSRLRTALLEERDASAVIAALWWRLPITWNGEMQQRTPFRRSSPQESFFLTMKEDDDEPGFCLMQEDGVLKPSERFELHEFVMAEGVQPWFGIDYREVLLELAETCQMELSSVSRRYGEITLRVGEKGDSIEKWRYHPVLGVFREY
ncbi:type I-F CRISPR-associated helicase Cas3f [Raoultella ornithinolytica]|uniref:type I-F CRISPR-associated helicase Cas3f n=2 Tax=Raoultella ornithinolytica TaxID=54291 RepID=UPI00292A7BFB|nr:type I-F CRISPR-associated helicase Cas3f [Raoultella ornithinolytica]MDV0588487.1 type I-F CRISPR-associated helicase Cas3f [Raoultella ornithinolytica]